jgi:hypothetical protein
MDCFQFGSSTRTGLPQIRDDLASHIDANDRLFVARLSGETSWTKLMTGAEKFL